VSWSELLHGILFYFCCAFFALSPILFFVVYLVTHSEMIK